MKNEPVAWFEQDENMKSVWYQCDKNDPSAVPLYTHPAKTLTDEEIIKVNEDIGTCWDVPHRFAIQIARAILRKAQEK